MIATHGCAIRPVWPRPRGQPKIHNRPSYGLNTAHRLMTISSGHELNDCPQDTPRRALALLCNMIVEGELLPNRGASVACSKLAAQWNAANDHHEDILTALDRRDGAHLATIMRDHVRHKAIVTRQANGAVMPVRESNRFVAPAPPITFVGSGRPPASKKHRLKNRIGLAFSNREAG
jgi:hypothetical protein